MRKAYVYRVLDIDVSNPITDREYQIDAEKIVYAGPPTGPQVQIKLNSKDANAIPLNPKSTLTAPFTRFFITVPGASGTVQLWISSPKEILLETGDIDISSIANVERVSSGSQNKVSVTDTSVEIAPSNTNRKKLRLRNTGANNVYLSIDGGDAVADDYPLGPQEELVLENYTGSVKGICDTGLSSTVRYLSEG